MKRENKLVPLVKVKAVVIRQTLFTRKVDAQISRKNPVIIMKLQEIGTRKVNNIQFYISLTKTVACLRLQPGDTVTFYGHARAGASGYHFVNPHRMEVARQPAERVVGVLKPGQTLRDFIDQL